MKRIWAPWRRPYITRQKWAAGCLFCKARRASKKNDPKNFLLRRSSHTFLILNRFPYQNGHTMLVPNRHVSSLEVLNQAERLDLLDLLDLTLKLLRKAIHPKGFNVGLNLGRVGGAGVPGHVHLHVVPRWLGDTNFMPILAETKVISDSLTSSYRHLTRVLEKIC